MCVGARCCLFNYGPHIGPVDVYKPLKKGEPMNCIVLFIQAITATPSPAWNLASLI